MSCWLIAIAGHGCIFRQKITCNFLCYVRFLALLSPLIKEMRNGTQVNFKMTFELNSHRASVCGLISWVFLLRGGHRVGPTKNWACHERTDGHLWICHVLAHRLSRAAKNPVLNIAEVKFWRTVEMLYFVFRMEWPSTGKSFGCKWHRAIPEKPLVLKYCPDHEEPFWLN